MDLQNRLAMLRTKKPNRKSNAWSPWRKSCVRVHNSIDRVDQQIIFSSVTDADVNDWVGDILDDVYGSDSDSCDANSELNSLLTTSSVKEKTLEENEIRDAETARRKDQFNLAKEILSGTHENIRSLKPIRKMKSLRSIQLFDHKDPKPCDREDVFDLHNAGGKDENIREECRGFTNDSWDASIRSVDESLFATAELGNSIRFVLIDTGASINLINEKVYEEFVKALPPHAIALLDERHENLTVRVANSHRWILRKSINLTIYLDGCPFTGEFWIAPALHEDILLGVHSLKASSIDVCLRTSETDHKGNTTGSFMRMTKYDNQVIPLQDTPGGVCSAGIELVSVKAIEIPTRTRMPVVVKPLSNFKIPWPHSLKGGITGRVDLSSTLSPTLQMHLGGGGVRLHPTTQCTTIWIENTSFTKKQSFFPGDVLSNFTPLILHTMKESNGNTLLYSTVTHQLVEKVIAEEPASYTGPLQDSSVWKYDVLQLDNIPVARRVCRQRTQDRISMKTKRRMWPLGKLKGGKVRAPGLNESPSKRAHHRIPPTSTKDSCPDDIEWLTETEREQYLSKYYFEFDKQPTKSAMYDSAKKNEALVRKVLSPTITPGEFDGNMDDLLDQQGLGLPDEEPPPDIEAWNLIGNKDPIFRADVKKIMNSYIDVFKDRQGGYPNMMLPEWAHQKLKLKEGVFPKRAKPYPMSKSKEKAMAEILRDRLKKGIIERSNSPYASPSFLVEKSKKGTYRLIWDGREINKSLEFNCYPLPRTNSILSKLSGAKYFSKIDLRSGFDNIPLDENSRDLASFVTTKGCFRYRTSPQGCLTSSAHFQNVFDVLLKEIGVGAANLEEEEGEIAGVYNYLDDLCLYSESLEKHLELLDQTLALLRRYGFCVRLDKCEIAYTELKFLGRILTPDGVKPDPEKVRAVVEIPKPTGQNAKKKLRGIIGSYGFYAEHLNHFSGIVRPLNSLLQKGKNVENDWKKEHDQALERMKHELTNAPLLAYPDDSKPKILRTDASKGYISGILSQKNDDNTESVLEYGSHTLNSTQVRWSVIEKEAYAITWSFARYRRFLEGKQDTEVYTDAKSLLFMRANKYEDRSNRLIRWFNFLDRFTFKLHHISGEDNKSADNLTRCYDGEDLTEEDPAANWIYPPLLKHVGGLEKKIITELRFDGPSCTSILMNRGHKVHQLPGIQGLKQAIHWDKSTLVIAAPPVKTQEMRKVLSHLSRAGSWAIWAPLSLLAENYFNEIDVQVIVVQGGRSYAHKHSLRWRSAWICHNLHLPDTVMFERIDISDSTIHTKSLTKESSNKSKLRAQSRIHNKHDREEQKSLKEISDRQEAQNVKLGDQVFESVVNRISKNKIFQSLPVTMHSVLRQFDELSNTELNQSTGTDGTEDTPTSRLFMPKAPSSNPTGNLTFSEQVRGIFQKKDPLDEESEDLDIPIKGRFRVSEFLRDRVLKHEQNLSDTQALRFGSKLEKIRNYHILKQMEDSLNSGNFVGSLENDEQKLNWGSMPFSQKVMRALQANDEECQKIIKELNDPSQKSTWATVRSGTPSSGSLTHFVQNDILMVSPPRHKSAHKGALLQSK